MVRLSKSLKLESDAGLFYYSKGRLLRPDTNVRSLDPEISPEDGFLYLTAERQAAYGGDE